MPKPRKTNKDDNIKINEKESGIAEFTKRPVPNDDQVEKFDELIGEEIESFYASSFVNTTTGKNDTEDKKEQNGELDEEIEESLNEIYQDGRGNNVNVKKLEIKKKHSFLFWFFIFFIIISGIGGAGYAAYYYLLEQPGSDATAVEFSLEGKNEVTAGEEYIYTVHYKNSSNINIKNARILLTYPDNFIFQDSSPVAKEKNSIWEFSNIVGQSSGKIQVKGKLIGPEEETGIVLAKLTYTPENFSSEFKKETSVTTTINDIGINFNFDYITSVLVGEENELRVSFNAKENSYINNFRFTIEPKENVKFMNYMPAEEIEKEDKEDSEVAQYSILRPGVWQIEEVLDEEKYVPIKFKFTEKKDKNEKLVLNFELAQENDATSTEDAQSKQFQFYEEELDFEVMKSDLNLTLIINGSREDQGVDFGQTLNYSIVYANKGETEMKDVVIMAVMDSDFLDWTTLNDELGGREKGNTISWSKEEITELEVIARDEEGVIDFSINVMDIDEINMEKDYSIKSYTQFSVGNLEEIKEDADTQSNTIINKINSDLDLSEEVRYFSEENIPVGTGPHPPKAGEETSYKVYWDLSNNLHELNDLKIFVKLPEYVRWNNKNQATVGIVKFNEENRIVTWNIGRLPISVYRASAEFSIKITPEETDKNTIMVLVPGTTVQAVDDETKDELELITKAQTTKLEDDEIGKGDGIVE